MYVGSMSAVEQLERGRAACARSEWRDAYAALSSAGPLAGDDLQLLATAAYMVGHDGEYLSVLERAHQVHLDAGDPLRAAMAAYWVGMHLMLGGEPARGTGWLARAQRLVEREERDCVERGYLLMPLAFQRDAAGDLDGALAATGAATAVAERFGDRDLFALAVHQEGEFLIGAGRVTDGLGLLDEAMVAVTTGELSPIVSGIVYCAVILACQAAYEPRRAQEWTVALTRWCEGQPDMVAFTGRCRVHRAEIMQLRGAWSDALDEARSAAKRAAAANHHRARAEAWYVQGDVHRLRGEFRAAEEAYREASGHGREPQPGLALLRLAQGRVDAAAAGIRRAVGEASGSKRMRLLPAYAEIMVAAGEDESARSACAELAELASGRELGTLSAIVAQTRGAVELSRGDAAAALAELRRAARLWEDIEAPYEVARVRALTGAGCRALGDEDAAALEFDAARRAFAELGATPDLARLDALAGGDAAGNAAGMTDRELQVLRLVAAGRTNRAIADELVLSERTVDRHVSNIFAKLGVSSRAAATAFAYEHHLV